MKKVLLSLAAVSFALTANAQLLKYGFEAGEALPGEIVAENWADFASSNYDFQYAGDANTGSQSLYAYTADETAECATYQRVIALTDLGIEPEKSYRVSFYVKGNGNMNVALLKGCFYHDKALQAGTVGTYKDQTYNYNVEDAGSFRRVTFNFWSPSREVMTEVQGDFANDEYWAKDFLRFSFFGIGTYIVDDVVVDESAVKDVTCKDDVIRVRFGYDTNAAELAKAAGGTLVLDNSTVKVTIDGEEEEPLSVEVKEDGNLYIFVNEYAGLDEESEVVVCFTNPGELKYTTNVAPESFTNPNCAVYSFENEVAIFDDDLYATSVAYEEANLVVANPEDGSFEIDENIDTFSFTFNKLVSTYDEENGAPIATLDGEELVIVEASEPSETLVFKRTSTNALGKGNHTIVIENVCNLMNVATTQPFYVTFEVGKVQVAQTIYTDLFTTLLEGANGGQPTNWSILVGGENWTGGEPKADNGAACRNLNVTGSDGVEYTAFYLCDREGYTYMMYGDQEGAAIELPAGNLEFSVIALSHDEAGHFVEFRLEDMNGNELASATGACNVIANSQFTSIEGSDYIPATFNNPTAQNAILKVRAPQGGYTAVRVLGFRVRSYEMTEGDTSDSQIIFASNFTGANMPAEGTGWLCYNNNDQLEPGSGRNGTSGMLERNFHAKMQTAAFFRECGANADAAHRIEYGNGNGVEDGLAIAPGSYEIVYYAGTWNDNGGNANGTSKVFFQLIDVATGAVALDNEHVNIANFENGAACNGQADKVVVSFKPTTAGNYIIKAWGTTNTVWGGLSIEKEGSRAVKYHTMLNEALELAKNELETAMSSDEYAGTCRDALAQAIEDYTDPDFHTAHEYTDAIAHLEQLVKAMAARRVAIAAFKTDIVKLGEALETIADTKYENLECVPALKALYAKYAEIAPSTLEDEELLYAQAEIAKGASMISTVMDAVNNLLAKQINNLLNAISVYADNLDNEFVTAWIIEGENAISDNQKVANELQKILTACIYDAIDKGYNFSTYIEEAEMEVADSLDITGYIANNMIYTVNRQKNYNGSEANAAFPGWNITEGTVSNVWWWENTLTIDDAHPAVNASIRNIGGNAFKVNQELHNLPVGVYTMTMLTADCSNVADVSTTYVKKDENLPWSNSVVYAVVGQDSVCVEANYGEGQVWRNAANTYVYGIKGNGELTVDMTIGADINCTSDAAQVDDTKLYMTGKLEGFNYRAAADEILKNVPEGIDMAERTDAPVNVTFFNLNGQHTAAPQGVSLKVERYADGYTVVKKVIVK